LLSVSDFIALYKFRPMFVLISL